LASPHWVGTNTSYARFAVRDLGKGLRRGETEEICSLTADSSEREEEGQGGGEQIGNGNWKSKKGDGGGKEENADEDGAQASQPV